MGPRAGRITRRMAIAALPLALVACERKTPGPGPTTSSTTSTVPLESAAPAARKLLADVRAGLEDAVDSLDWKKSEGERAQSSGSTCSYSSTTWRTDTYLGHERGTPERIARVLSGVLRDHGWPECRELVGDAGGWLTTESTRDGLTFSFRSKGYAEIGVDGAVSGACRLPESATAKSDGGGDG